VKSAECEDSHALAKRWEGEKKNCRARWEGVSVMGRQRISPEMMRDWMSARSEGCQAARRQAVTVFKSVARS
jgi:hypothetical protein